MVTKVLLKGSFGQSVVEVILTVVGILIALWVDEWRSDFAEKKSLQLHLAGVVNEIDANRQTLHWIREGAMPKQIADLEKVIHILD